MDERQYMANEAKRLAEEQRRAAAIEAELRKAQADENLRREAERQAQEQRNRDAERGSWNQPR